MELTLIPIDKFLGKDYLNFPIPNQQETLERFQIQLNQYLDTIRKRNENSAAETDLASVFKDLLLGFYKYDVRTNHKAIDLSIWSGEHLKVIIEAKRSSNTGEMISDDDLNKKAFYEVLFYYYEQSRNENQHLIKNIIITDFIKLYVFDSRQFLNLISIKKIKDTFLEFQKDKDGFYKKMPLLSLNTTLEACKIDLFDENLDIGSLYRIIDKHSLLGTPLENKDNNVLDNDFYNELLYIMGLHETLNDKKIPVIRPLALDNKDNHSLYTMIAQKIQGMNSKNIKQWNSLADTESERIFTFSLELILTWVNRILFLKLLEAQLISYHPGEQKEYYQFLDPKKLNNWQDVSTLFFDILAKPLNERQNKEIPYLNSSLFEKTEYESIIGIDSFNPNDKLIPYAKGILKDKKPRPTLQYLLEFLDAYNFGTGDKEIPEDKRLINASVLGLVFEKINGYTDGAVYTPSFITMSMSKEALTHTVIQKFNEAKNWNCASLPDLKNKIFQTDLPLDDANRIFNSIRICDPAVGSGHFLVSCLNELLRLKYELKILINRKGELISHCDMSILHDELLIAYNGKNFTYEVNAKNTPLVQECQSLQETLFHEKETLIENCLFGVDINPKSAYICQLRLWIELLKNTYYIQDGDRQNLQTLPNIDINIKCGNSLIFRFPLRQDFTPYFSALKSHNITIEGYQEAVALYKNSTNKSIKAQARQKIDYIKEKIRTAFLSNDTAYIKLQAKYNSSKDIYEASMVNLALTSPEQLAKEKDAFLQAEAAFKKAGNIYHNSLEWRYEFPEVLDENGNFLGFDLIIGNPPYFRYSRKIPSQEKQIDYFRSHDIYNVACIGKINAYEVFLLLSYHLCKDGGFISEIFQNSFLADTAAKGVRKHYIEKTKILQINSFPERDNHKKRVFENVKMSVLTLLSHKKGESTTLPIKIYPDRMQSPPKEIETDISLIRKIDAENMEIPNLNNKELAVFAKCYAGTIRIENIADVNEGELNLTFFSTYFTDDPAHPQFYVGANVQKYYITETPSQRTIPSYYNQEQYLSDISKRTAHIKNPRLVCQGISGVNDKYRLIFTVAPANIGLGNSVNYMVLKDGVTLDLRYIMGLLNSCLLNWLFKARSTNANINNYELERLPIPQASPAQQAPIIKLVQACMDAKAANPKADISATQAEIDALVYGLYGLTEGEIKIVEG